MFRFEAAYWAILRHLYTSLRDPAIGPSGRVWHMPAQCKCLYIKSLHAQAIRRFADEFPIGTGAANRRKVEKAKQQPNILIWPVGPLTKICWMVAMPLAFQHVIKCVTRQRPYFFAPTAFLWLCAHCPRSADCNACDSVNLPSFAC